MTPTTGHFSKSEISQLKRSREPDVFVFPEPGSESSFQAHTLATSHANYTDEPDGLDSPMETDLCLYRKPLIKISQKEEVQRNFSFQKSESPSFSRALNNSFTQSSLNNSFTQSSINQHFSSGGHRNGSLLEYSKNCQVEAHRKRQGITTNLHMYSTLEESINYKSAQYASSVSSIKQRENIKDFNDDTYLPISEHVVTFTKPSLSDTRGSQTVSSQDRISISNNGQFLNDDHCYFTFSNRTTGPEDTAHRAQSSSWDNNEILDTSESDDMSCYLEEDRRNHADNILSDKKMTVRNTSAISIPYAHKITNDSIVRKSDNMFPADECHVQTTADTNVCYIWFNDSSTSFTSDDYDDDDMEDDYDDNNNDSDKYGDNKSGCDQDFFDETDGRGRKFSNSKQNTFNVSFDHFHVPIVSDDKKSQNNKEVTTNDHYPSIERSHRRTTEIISSPGSSMQTQLSPSRVLSSPADCLKLDKSENSWPLFVNSNQVHCLSDDFAVPNLDMPDTNINRKPLVATNHLKRVMSARRSETAHLLLIKTHLGTNRSGQHDPIAHQNMVNQRHVDFVSNDDFVEVDGLGDEVDGLGDEVDGLGDEVDGLGDKDKQHNQLLINNSTKLSLNKARESENIVKCFIETEDTDVSQRAQHSSLEQYTDVSQRAQHSSLEQYTDVSQRAQHSSLEQYTDVSQRAQHSSLEQYTDVSQRAQHSSLEQYTDVSQRAQHSSLEQYTDVSQRAQHSSLEQYTDVSQRAQHSSLEQYTDVSQRAQHSSLEQYTDVSQRAQHSSLEQYTDSTKVDQGAGSHNTTWTKDVNQVALTTRITHEVSTHQKGIVEPFGQLLELELTDQKRQDPELYTEATYRNGCQLQEKDMITRKIHVCGASSLALDVYTQSLLIHSPNVRMRRRNSDTTVIDGMETCLSRSQSSPSKLGLTENNCIVTKEIIFHRPWQDQPNKSALRTMETGTSCPVFRRMTYPINMTCSRVVQLEQDEDNMYETCRNSTPTTVTDKRFAKRTWHSKDCDPTIIRDNRSSGSSVDLSTASCQIDGHPEQLTVSKRDSGSQPITNATYIDHTCISRGHDANWTGHDANWTGHDASWTEHKDRSLDFVEEVNLSSSSSRQQQQQQQKGACIRSEDEVDIHVQVVDVFNETIDLRQRLDRIYQADDTSCQCRRIEQNILHIALDMFRNLGTEVCSRESWLRELQRTNNMTSNALDLAENCRRLCSHGRHVTDVLPGSVIIRIQCPTLTSVIDLCDLLASGDLHVILLQIIRHHVTFDKLGLTLRVTLDPDSLQMCQGYLLTQMNKHHQTRSGATVTLHKQVPTSRALVRSTDNLLFYSPNEDFSTEIIKQEPIQSIVSTVCPSVALATSTAAHKERKREREITFSFGEINRTAFRELNISDVDTRPSSPSYMRVATRPSSPSYMRVATQPSSPSYMCGATRPSSLPFMCGNTRTSSPSYMRFSREETLQTLGKSEMVLTSSWQLHSPNILHSPKLQMSPGSSPLTSPRKPKVCDIVSEQENIDITMETESV